MKVASDVVTVIPARAGSKRIRDKNLQEVGGRTLLQRAIETAIRACGVAIVSTDDERYAAHARAAGAVVPGLRPKHLAEDDSTTDEVVRHALLEWCENTVEIVVVVQATTPFTVPGDITAAVAALRASPDAGTALTCARVQPHIAYLLSGSADGLARFALPDLRSHRTQAVPPLHVPTGGVYAAPAERLRSGGVLIEEPVAIVEVPLERALDIDEVDDLAVAKRTAQGSRSEINAGRPSPDAAT